MIINAENLILGRLGAFTAKQSLLGEQVNIVNCKDAIIIGKREVIFKKYKEKQNKTTPRKGPFIPKTPDKFVKRAIRGMLPYKKGRGREAFSKIRCYKSIPESFKNQEIISLDKFNVLKTNNINFVKVQDVCKYLGGK